MYKVWRENYLLNKPIADYQRFGQVDSWWELKWGLKKWMTFEIPCSLYQYLSYSFYEKKWVKKALRKFCLKENAHRQTEKLFRGLK
jgi:hypothetical protein